MKTVILKTEKKLERGIVEAGQPVTVDAILANAWIAEGSAIDPADRSSNGGGQQAAAAFSAASPAAGSAGARRVEELRANIDMQRARVGEEAYAKVIGNRRPDILKDIDKLTAINEELKVIGDK